MSFAENLQYLRKQKNVTQECRKASMILTNTTGKETLLLKKEKRCLKGKNLRMHRACGNNHLCCVQLFYQ